jgi:hypothetical protein
MEVELQQTVTQVALLDEVKRFELFRSVIDHEDDLLNQRVSWIILAQSFLMAAFITNSSTGAMKLITAIIGLSTVIITTPAILAASRNIELQQHIYFAGIVSDERCQQLHGHGRKIVTLFEEKEITTKEEHDKRLIDGHIFPTMAFRGQGAIPILYTVVGLSTVQILGWIFLLAAFYQDW